MFFFVDMPTYTTPSPKLHVAIPTILSDITYNRYGDLLVFNVQLSLIKALLSYSELCRL